MASASAVSMAMGSLNYGLFIRPMGDELGIGRATFGWAQTARHFASSGTSPGVGWLLDRYGSRVMLPVAAHMTQGWHLIVLFSLMGLVGMSGPGALVTSVPVLKWFVRNRGKAISFRGLGIPIGALLFVPLTQVFIVTLGWRNTWFLLTIIGMAVIVPLAAIFVRRHSDASPVEAGRRLQYGVSGHRHSRGPPYTSFHGPRPGRNTHLLRNSL